MLRRLLLPAIVLSLLASLALAHGGGGFRGPPGPPPPGCSEPWSGPPVPPPEEYGRGPVVGRVLSADGAPLEDARVWSERWQSASTAADGGFRCAPDRYPATLVITAADHAPRVLIACARPAPGAHLDLGDLALESGASIEGRVEQAEGSRDNLRIRIVPEQSRVPEAFALAARLNGWDGVWVRDGRSFSFRGLPEGRYRVVASRGVGPDVIVGRDLRPGGEALVVRPSVVPTNPEAPDFEYEGSLRLTRAKGCIVQVFDRESGREVLSRRDVDRFDVPVPVGAVLDVVLADADGLLLPLEGLRAGQEVALPPATGRLAIAGRVTRSDGSPVARAKVFVCSAVDPTGAIRRQSETDAGGRFRVDGVVGRLRVEVWAPGLTNDDRPCRVVAGDERVQVIVAEERLPGIPPLRDLPVARSRRDPRPSRPQTLETERALRN